MKKLALIILICIFALVSCKTTSAQTSTKPFSNPAIIYGTDFLTYFKTLRGLGNYAEMLKFTTSKSIEKHGKNAIMVFYVERCKNMSKVKLVNITSNSDGTKTLNYINDVVATKNTFSINVIIENDSCKIILPEKLDKDLFN